jgi:hypothetical protein
VDELGPASEARHIGLQVRPTLILIVNVVESPNPIYDAVPCAP